MTVRWSGVRRAGAVAAVPLILGGGLFGWHQYLDADETRPPAVSLSHGECQGLLDDPRFGATLGAARTVSVHSQSIQAQSTDPLTLSCSVQGAGRRTLTVTAAGWATDPERVHEEYGQAPRDFLSFPEGEADAHVGVVRFTCVTKSPADGTERTRYYLATLSLTDSGDKSYQGPGGATTAELVVAFARRAAAKPLACTNPVDLPDGPITLH
ncbi:hypothetical protein [Kitasatospora kifunensis]|uniref:Uncharacterized protein n=1 Tax=Kitasatospora kifunensis TaxID=58351 RepID=A0A7W7VUE7_KITKI|nr:hypothetical protein [Kitasatospora kifunensis]MBB4922410.1 hypothetical protein [Kitasatospora kifunensis]